MLFPLDQSVTSLYRKVVSPSVKFHTEGLQKETHARHIPYNGQSSLALRRLAASPTLTVPQTSRHTYSAPGRVENRNILAKVGQSSYVFCEKRPFQDPSGTPPYPNPSGVPPPPWDTKRENTIHY